MSIRIILTLLYVCFITAAFGQEATEQLKGSISYVGSQNIYVKFNTTEGIHIGDTLYALQNDKLIPAIKVSSLSSISCVGSVISSIPLAVSMPIVAKRAILKLQPVEGAIPQNEKKSVPVNDQVILAVGKKDVDKPKARFDGRVSVSSYTYLDSLNSSQRFRYTLSLNSDHYKNSKYSAETYVTFTHKLGETIKIYDALKVYSLALKYDINKTSSVSFGRKINMNMANIGAVDGVQYEKTNKTFSYGALIGSRPDYFDYSFNPKLLQFGAFLSHNIQNKNGVMQTSVAVFNQMNDFKTDRRFAYIQHANSLVKNVDLFCSFEIDLYGMVNNKLTTTADLTSTYISLRYKPIKKLSLSLSYDARKNIYYYETFKNQLDDTLDKVTRQGLRFQTLYRPFKYFIWGTTAGSRFQAHTKATMNGSSFISYTNLPFNTSATITATAYKTNYTDGTVYGASMSRDFFSGKFNAELEYRAANYSFSTSPTPLKQDIAEFSLFWRIAKKLTLSADFEATIEKNNTSGRVYINLSQRF